MLTVLNGSVVSDSTLPLVANVDWNKIETVMVDMDGTLIDLGFDHTIWNHILPTRVSERHSMSFEEAKRFLYGDYKPPFSLDFYNIDRWTEITDIDVMGIHRECTDLLSFRPGAVEFLQYLKDNSVRVVIATNCHPKSFELKDSCLSLRDKVDSVHSSADFGIAKDDVAYWDCMSEVEKFSRSHTLFIDDVSFILDKGWEAGIQFLMTIRRPNSLVPAQNDFYYPVIDDFRDLIPN